MKRTVEVTADGSSTIYAPTFNQHYHSTHGALQESRHVFIDAGLAHCSKSSVSILEIGFGTGLNALLTAIEAKNQKKKIRYVGLEKYPIQSNELPLLNYTSVLNVDAITVLFEALHTTPWEIENALSPNFSLEKREQNFLDIDDENAFDIIYYDAFAPNAQPELWTEEIFKKMFEALKTGGFLVTYCAKGQVKRNMKAVGFLVEGLPGPPGKREMTRATKAI